MSEEVTHKIIMMYDVASEWVTKNSCPEYRVTIFVGHDKKKMISLLKSFRDGRISLGGIDPLNDLGITEASETITVWSADRVALKQVVDWFESRGFESTGIW